MLVSVIIPTYNNGDNLDKTLESVFKQSHKDIEIIVVNDCSTDSTEVVIQKHLDRIKYLALPENKGGSFARNKGFAISSGEYVAFLDADDIWKPSFIEKQLESIKSNDSVAVYCHAEDELGNTLGGPHQGNFINELLLGKADIVSTSALVIRRDVFISVGGFDVAFQRHQDLEFIIRIMKSGFVAVNAESLFYKINSGSPSFYKAMSGIKLFWRKFDADIKALNYFSERYVYAKGYLRLAELALSQRLWCEFIKNGLMFVLFNPVVIFPRVKRYFRKVLTVVMK